LRRITVSGLSRHKLRETAGGTPARREPHFSSR
jgi:hypothetical protein